MWTIKNAFVTFYEGGKVGLVNGNYKDQDYETLIKLGRGQMFVCSPGNMVLKYNLSSGVQVTLWM